MRRGGFTLIEALVSTALMALLLVAVMQIVATIGRDRRSVAASARPADDIITLLRWDLANAHSARFGPDRLTLTGHGALSRRTLAASHGPVRITYELLPIAGRKWLVRRQAGAAEPSAEPAWSELIASDVAAFALEPARGAAGGGIKLLVAEQPVPPAVRVRLAGASGWRADETIVVR